MLLFLLPSLPGWAYWTLMSVYMLTILAIVAIVVSENRNPLKSLAWVTVLLLLPMVGIVLYLFFGRSIKNTRMISRRNRRKLKKAQRPPRSNLTVKKLSAESARQIQLGRSLTGAHFWPGNRVEVFTDGRSKFEALKADLRRAQHSICLEYYIIDNDRLGGEIRDILVERARAGVQVRVVYDHVGSFGTPARFFKEMRRAGVQAYPFFKVSFPLFGTRINWRNHRKIVVIDGRVGYIGGMNVADRYIDGGKHAVWRDTHLRISGPAVSGLLYAFAVDWNFMGQPLIEEPTGIDTLPDDSPVTAAADVSDVGVQIITSGPTSQWGNVAMSLYQAIGHARKRVYIQTPYFLPTEGLLRVLQTAALAHVDVRIMMPRDGDSLMLSLASSSYVDECLKSGIKIYLYESGMMHAKTVLIDDEIATVGSTNFDFRSFEHNFEANAFLYSSKLNAALVNIYHRDLQSCTRILPEQWRERSRLRRAGESLVRLLSPVL